MLHTTVATTMSFGMNRGWAWNLGVKCVRPILNSLSKDGYIKDIPFGARGWFRCRDLRAVSAKTFHERWKDLLNEPVCSVDIDKKETI